MLSTSAFLQAMLPLYIIAAIGFIARKTKILSGHVNQAVTQLMLYITLPALILFSLNAKLSRELIKEFTWLISMSIFILGISILLGLKLRRRAALSRKQKSVYESLIIFGNQGFIGFSIIYILMGKQGIIYLTFFNLFYFILIWTYGIYIFTKNEAKINWKGLFLNPGILSTLVGFCMLFFPFGWPTIFLDTLESIGKMTVPLSMILIGSLLAEVHWHYLRAYIRNVYIWIAAICKLIIIPFFLLIFLLFHVPYHLLIIATLTSAMPSAPTITIYAQKFSSDTSFASFGVLLTTILCVITIPVLYSFLQWLLPFFY